MTTYRNRKAVQLENETLRITVLTEGGHIAELFHILDDFSQISPMFIVNSISGYIPKITNTPPHAP